MYISRAIEDVILQTSQTFKVLMLTGPRQTGKTTLLQKLADSERRYVTLDDLALRSLAQSDPQLFLSRFEAPVLIDEIQYAPELLPYIKIDVDKKQQNGAYWLTGSQMFHAMRGLSESLAGRVGIIDLFALSQREVAGSVSAAFSTDPRFIMTHAKTAPAADLKAIYERIFQGGMPQLVADPRVDRDRFFASYVATYIERDIRDLTQISSETAFLRFMTVVAAHTARPLVMEEIAQAAEVTAPTVKRWLSLLSSTGIIALVQPFHHSALKRAVKMPLLHFMDTGLAAYLTGWTSPAVLERGAMTGQFFETWVFTELYKSFINAGVRPPIYYYRDKDKKEIDLLLHQNGTLYPMEIKKTANPGLNDIRNFSVLSPLETMRGQLKVQVGNGAVLCMIPEPLPINNSNWYVPARII
ncbi:MAG: ATP-binding protein [Coriobacteriales bacterium]|jgi:predicted AAA+ superfamily ATPase|nr:ATP-binding protein [Coriobacteriales bacterium]